MESVLNLFNSGFGAFVSVAYFQTLSGKHRVDKLEIWKVYLGLMVAFLFVVFIDNYGVKLLAVSAIVFALSYLYDISVESRVFLTGTFVVVCSLASAFSIAFSHFFSGSGLPFIAEYIEIISDCIFCACIYGFVEFIKSKEVKVYSANQIDSSLSILSLAPVFLILFLQLIVSYSFEFRDEIGAVESLVFITLLSILLLYNLLTFVAAGYRAALIAEKDVKDEAHRSLELKREHYRELLDQHRRSHKEIHDLKNKILVVILAVKLNKRDFALNKLEELSGDTFSTSSSVNTGNEVVDAVLGSKKPKLSENEIELNLHTKISDEVNVNDFDIAVIVGNAIDNAIEACLKLPAEERYIEVEIEEDNDQLLFIFTNPTTENLEVVENVVQTSKDEDRYLHGFGLENMRNIARKYNGTSTVNCEGGFFELKLNLQIPQ